MAELHVQVIASVEPSDRAGLRRYLDALADRVGRRAQIRTATGDRAADATFAQLVASKGRLPIQTVRMHVCRHDEGIGDCSTAPMTVG